MLVFSKLKANVWPKVEKVFRLIEQIGEEKARGGNI
jgi:hypothetical protein